MNQEAFNKGLFEYIGKSPTQFHAVENLGDMFERAGFTRLYEKDTWHLDTGGRYFIKRNNSSIIAFTCGGKKFVKTGIRMVGAHTDSPGLKIKPRPELINKSYLRLGVEVYGSPLLSTWFDRELSIAGRVTYVDEQGGPGAKIKSTLIDFKHPVVVIPNLAIHLDRDANNGKTINKQKDLPPLLMLSENDDGNLFRALLSFRLKKKGVVLKADTDIEYDLMLYDVNIPVFTGMNREFITSGRLDNLVSCYCGAASLIENEGAFPGLLVCSDHEEVGSISTSGAAGTFLKSVTRRLCPDPEHFGQMVDRSLMVSADNAHSVHPNFSDKYDDNHSPVINRGPVIKVNANQRYATDSQTNTAFRYLCRKADVPIQDFVVRSDLPCGSTIGPVTAGGIGIKTIDTGIPMLAMHSIRETAGNQDAYSLYRVLCEHYRTVLDMSSC